MSHVLTIALIFGAYLALMVGLGVYIWSTGRHEDQSAQDQDAGTAGDAEMTAA